MAREGPIERVLAAIAAGDVKPVYLVAGDLVVAEPAGLRLAKALVGDNGSFETHRRPSRLSNLVGDLQTFSLFGGGKVVVAIDSAVLADRKSAAALVGEALDIAPPAGDGLAGTERAGASRLLQALYLFGIDPHAGTEAVAISELPDWTLAGAKGGRVGKVQAKSRREALESLLGAARREGLQGIGDDEVAQLDDMNRRGLPRGHALILVERGVDVDHPLVARLREREALIEVATVRSEKRGGWSGVESMVEQLESDLGVGIRRDALQELIRRTLKATAGRQSDGGAQGDSTARFAAEYRKLAELSPTGPIDRSLVERVVVDRGEEDVWKLLDAVGEGRVGEALSRLDRLLAASEDPVAARFSFFSLFAGFCRQLTLVRGVAEEFGVRGGERNYNAFKGRVAPRLTADFPAGGKNPLAGTHPFRLHRAYLAAFRLPEDTVGRLPEWVLETELALKGESGEPMAALAGLLGRFR